MNINEAIEKAESEYGLGKGEYFKVQEGVNKIRVVSELVFHEGNWQGKPNYKMVCWVIDRRDGVVKPYFMPLTIARTLGTMQEEPEYAFKDFPMPYDITINAKGAGTKEVEYQVVAARQNTSLTEAEKEAIMARPNIEVFVAKLNGKKQEQAPLPVETPADIVARASAGKFVPKQAPEEVEFVPVDETPAPNAPDFLK